MPEVRSGLTLVRTIKRNKIEELKKSLELEQDRITKEIKSEYQQLKQIMRDLKNIVAELIENGLKTQIRIQENKKEENYSNR